MLCFSVVLPEHCPPFSVSNGRLVLSRSFNLGSVAKVVCETEYIWTGSMERVCQINMDWSGNAGQCRRKIIDYKIIVIFCL